MTDLRSLRNKRINILKAVIFALMILIAADIALITIFSISGKTIRIEAGDRIDLADVFKDADAEFDADFDTDMLDHPGTYKTYVYVGSKKKQLKIVVTDTKAPEITLHEKVCISSLDFALTPEHLVKSGYDPDGYSGHFITNMNFEFRMGSSYAVKVYYTDPSGNRTEDMQAVISFIKDTEAPVIEINGDISFATDDAISYKQFIKVSDNCIGDIALEVDDSKVDYKTIGEYEITVNATDLANNTSTLTAKVSITAGKSYDPSLEKLNKKLSELMPSIINGDMTSEQKCRQIYNYVQKNITYASTSKSDDYVDVAYDALFVSKEGDCFAFFAAAKAMLNYLEIENMDIERSDDGIDGTHFWNYVNIGTKESPRWYHFDCTRLNAKYNESGCLLTLAQVEAYDKWRYESDHVYFRQYDRSKYPKTSTEIITETPNIKDYMK